MRRMVICAAVSTLFCLNASAFNLINVEAVRTAKDIRFTAFYDAPLPEIDPITAGGWTFQLFLDVDQNDATGYTGWGWDYMVSGVYADQLGNIPVISLPGGYGPQVGTIPYILSGKKLRFDVPLAMLGSDDGYLDYQFEWYNTVDCPKCPGGTAAALADYRRGSTGTGVPEPASVLLFTLGAALLIRKTR